MTSHKTDLFIQVLLLVVVTIALDLNPEVRFEEPDILRIRLKGSYDILESDNLGIFVSLVL